MRKKVLIIGVVVVLVGVIIGLITAQRLQKEAAKIDAKVDWKAVATGQKPIYIVQYKVVKIIAPDLHEVEKKIEDLHLQVDIWNDEGQRREFLFGGATDTAIQKLREQGYTVEILYNSLEAYEKAMEAQ